MNVGRSRCSVRAFGSPPGPSDRTHAQRLVALAAIGARIERELSASGEDRYPARSGDWGGVGRPPGRSGAFPPLTCHGRHWVGRMKEVESLSRLGVEVEEVGV